MSISLENNQNIQEDKKPIKSLKESIITSSLAGKKVFSYSVKRTHSTVVLHQLETGFSLSMKMEKIEEVLRVTSFTIENETPLFYLSTVLHDAATIELAFQGVTSLFAYANRYDTSEIFFMLPEDEADDLKCFGCFFVGHSSFMTSEGSRVSFTLYNAPELRELLLKKVESIKTQVKQELWKAQRGDHYLKNYLQNHKQGEPLSFALPKPQSANSNMGNVIPFPKAQK
jgi:hypothetical protein